MAFFSFYHKSVKKSRPVRYNREGIDIFGIYDKIKSSVSVELIHGSGAFLRGLYRSLYLSRKLSAIMAINSELVGFPLLFWIV